MPAAVIMMWMLTGAAAAPEFQILHTFTGSDGANPTGSLLQGTDGALYGGTVATDGFPDTVFRISAKGEVSTLHAFVPRESGQGVNPLVQASDNNFYGTTRGGGMAAQGILFRLSPAGAFSVLHQFRGGPDGSGPTQRLVQARDGGLYGVTSAVTMFRMGVAGALTYQSWNLNPANSSLGCGQPMGLLQAHDGNFYTACASGGRFNGGMIVRISADGTVTALHQFAKPEGIYPGEMVEGSDGRFYGITMGGGTNNVGTFYRIEAAGELQVLHVFTSVEAPGLSSDGRLLEVTPRHFYGTTASSGLGTGGALFEISTDGTMSFLHSLNNRDGEGGYPSALVVGPDGRLYGETLNGGKVSPADRLKLLPYGTIFAYALGTQAALAPAHGVAAANPASPPSTNGSAPTHAANAPTTVPAAASAALPTVIHECEKSTFTICGTWTRNAGGYLGKWPGGSVAQLTVVRADDAGIQLQRVDSEGPATGLMANYQASRDAHGIYSGSVIFSLNGGTFRGSWTGSSSGEPPAP